MTTFILVLSFACCFGAGLLAGLAMCDKSAPVVGKFIWHTEPTSDHLFEIEFTKGTDWFKRKRFITFEIIKK